MADLPNQAELIGLLNFLRRAEALKHTIRSGYTSDGRPESVAEHSWRLTLMALTLSPYFPAVDVAHLVKMCIIHDLGEAVHGDIPAPQQAAVGGKTGHERRDFAQLIASLPPPQQAELLALWDEYEAAATPAARLAKALDKLETILQHNQGANPADFDYCFNLHYGRQYTADDPLIVALRRLLDEETATRAEQAGLFGSSQAARATGRKPLAIVTGAPGAGKSTVVETLQGLSHDVLVFDMDWLLPAASALAGKDVATEASTWPHYNGLWLAFLKMLQNNEQQALLFTPIDPDDLAAACSPGQSATVSTDGPNWLLLDCDDAIRRRRLAARPGWSEPMIAEALADAADLRSVIPTRIDTSHQNRYAVARQVLTWLGLNSSESNLLPDRESESSSGGGYTIKVSNDANPEIGQWLQQRIREFNNHHSSHHLHVRTHGAEPLHVAVHDDDGELMGGLTGSTYWQWLDIDDFWLPEALRGQGVGSELLGMAEAEARRRGCLRGQLRTFDFQARGFYERAGYRVVGVLDDYPPGGAMYWMRKDFAL